MPKPALIYAWTVIAIGTVVAAGAALLWQTTNAQAFWLCLGVAALASTFKVKLPGFESMIAPSFVFHLVAIAQFTGPESIAIAIVSGLVQSWWKPQSKPVLIQVAFNAATLAISNGIAYAIAHNTTAENGTVEHSLMLGIAGLVLFVVNTVTVSAVLCLLQKKPIRAVCRSLQSWAFPYYLAGGMLASVWVHIVTRPRFALAVFAALSVYLLSVCYREAIERIQ
jgi:hypothetical protein